MSSVLSGLKVAVLGGDDRELILASVLVKMGATVTLAGFPKEKISHGTFVANSVEEACKDSEVVILPLPGTNAEGLIRAVYSEERQYLTKEALQNASPNALVIIGTAQPFLKAWAEEYQLVLHEVLEMNELAILNSIPTAEGAVQIAMEETKFTIHGSNACVIGFGRVGTTLGRVLKAMGANVTVVSRENAELARAFEMGCKRASFTDLPDLLKTHHLVFNTVPAMVLTRDIIKYAYPEILIIDLATQPGGTDFEAANELSIKAILAPGLPGKVAPITAGQTLADVIPRLIASEMIRLNKNFLFV